MPKKERTALSRLCRPRGVRSRPADGPSFRTILNSVPYVMWSAGPDGRPDFISNHWARVYGGDPALLLGKGWTAFVHTDDLAGVLQSWQRAVESGEPHAAEFRMRLADGQYHWVLVNARAEKDADGSVLRWFGGFTDISERVLAYEELRWECDHDSLTSLPNRRAFQNRLQAAALRAMSSDTKLGLLLIDLDHFKHINDSIGHGAGDAVLQSLAARLRDAVGRDDFVARIGGDEFAIILEPIPGPEILLEVGRAVGAQLNSPVRIHQHAVNAAVSIGGAVFPDDADSANELLRLADTALHGLKAEGRGGTRLFESYMRAEAQRHASQLSLARVAVNAGSLVPLYQAKVSLRDGTICGYEALLRWHHPSRGLQMPETIREAFNDYELASKIGELMQTRVAADVRTWADHGFTFGRVSINASPAEFLRDDYAERLLERLRLARVDPRLVEVEVTEHVLMERGSQYVARALGVLKGAGVAVSLDDFGTGHSSLSHLRDYPVDVVKIDKTFVDNIATDAEMAAIVAAVVNLARSLGLETVAEGVETAAQADLLRSFGCDVAQGYLYARPAHGDAVAAALGRRSAA